MKLLKSIALIMGLLFVSYFVGATVYQWTLDSDRNGTAEFRVDTDGNTEIAGTLAVTGAATFTNIITPSGMSIVGVYTGLPTSGYSAGAIVVDKTRTYRVYVATATVTGVSCWVPIGTQVPQ